MRYLKKYDKLFESEVVNNCEDILLELGDQNFITNVIHTPRYPGNPEIIVLKIRRKLTHGEYDDENLFKYSEIEEYVERTIDYLEAETDFMMVKASIVWLRFPTYPRNRNLDTLNISDSRGGCVNKLRDFVNQKTVRYPDIPQKDREIIQTIYLHFTR
jgi:hypothetical protein